MKTPIAVLASGRGSNFEAVAKACRAGKLDAEIVALVTDNPVSPAIEIAKRNGVPAEVVPVPQGSGLKGERLREEHEKLILKALRPREPRFLVMAGYRRMVTPFLLEQFKSDRGYHRITNVHPSLLPSFPGVHSYEQAFEYGVKVTGVTVHLVDLKMDSGPVCAQESFSITDCASAQAVEKRGLEIEHRLYPQTLQWVLSESFDIEMRKGRPCVRPS